MATDSAFGLAWVNIERSSIHSTNPALTWTGVPPWAEPRSQAPIGEWRVGTLAVGWPWFMVTRQWSEFESDRLFVPHSEVDDDGFTIAKMATNFSGASRGATYGLIPIGIAANVAIFGTVAFLVFLPRVVSPPGCAAKQTESR